MSGFGATIASEWIKVRSGPVLRRSLAATALSLPAMSVLVGASASIEPDDTVLGGSLTGAGLSLLIAAAFGVLVMTQEYAGLLAASLTATPRRARLLGAKVVVVAGTLAVVVLPAALAAFGIGSVLLGEEHASGEPWPALVGVTAAFVVAGVLGLGLGTLVRSTSTALGLAAVTVLAPFLVAPLFGDLQRWIAGASSMAVVAKLAQSSDATAETMGSLGPWPSLLGVALLAGVLLGVAQQRFGSRDA